MERLFSYGTLQLEAVQMANFGRHLTGAPDLLYGLRAWVYADANHLPPAA